MKKPSPIAGLRLLAERTAEDRVRMLTLLECDHTMHIEQRDHIVARLYSDFEKMSERDQDRFTRILDTLPTDARVRVATIVVKREREEVQ